MKEFVQVNVGSAELYANPNIHQNVEVCAEYEKEQKLGHLLQSITSKPDHKTLVFVETKRKADDLTRRLRSVGWPVLAIHGDKEQKEREWVLQRRFFNVFF